VRVGFFPLLFPVRFLGFFVLRRVEFGLRGVGDGRSFFRRGIGVHFLKLVHHRLFSHASPPHPRCRQHKRECTQRIHVKPRV
jgi:hypothetical protein